MFRRKDNDPAPATSAPARDIAEPAFAAPQQETRPQPQPEMPRRQVETAPQMGGGVRTGAVTDAGGKRLTVGQGISLSGTITACDRLVVEGSVQVTLNETKAIEIAETGRFTEGKAEVEEAEISGVYEGELTVHKRLLIRGTGRVQGNVRYGELEIERGGRLQGTIGMLEDES